MKALTCRLTSASQRRLLRILSPERGVNMWMLCMAGCSDKREKRRRCKRGRRDSSDTSVFVPFWPQHFISLAVEWAKEVVAVGGIALPLWFWSCCPRSTSSPSCQAGSCTPPPPGKAPSHTTTSQLRWTLKATETRENGGSATRVPPRVHIPRRRKPFSPRVSLISQTWARGGASRSKKCVLLKCNRCDTGKNK